MTEKTPENFTPRQKTTEEMRKELELLDGGGEKSETTTGAAVEYSKEAIIDAARETLTDLGLAPGDVLGNETVRREVVEGISDKTGISLSGEELREALAAVSEGRRKDISRAA